MKILLVEDDVQSALVTSQIFVHKGHLVQSVHNGVDALSSLERDNYDVAVIDVVLPDLDGFLVAESLLEVQPQVKCVLVTGHFLPDGPERAHQLGAYFRTKPLDFKELEELFTSPRR